MYERLKKIRNDNSLTLNDMAKLIGLKTASAYYKKEIGKIAFTLEEAFIISKYFNKTAEEIFAELAINVGASY